MRRFLRRASVSLGLLVALSTVLPVAASATTSQTGGSAASVATATSAAAPKVVSKKPCAESRFTCITLRVPRDHFGSAANGPTFDVTFGLLKATGHKIGTFVTVTGGPGTSGLAAADGYTDGFDPSIPEHYDIVFFDQRGIGVSESLYCPNAALAFYANDAVPTVSDGQAGAYASSARTFSHDCIAETGVDPAALPFYSTQQAVEDLEAFRVYLKADQIDLYGESYGTQYVQTYAAAHPDRVRALYIDGPVDLTKTGFEYYNEDVHAFDTVLSDTLDRCTARKICKSDVVGGNALKIYDKLAAQLRSSPQSYSFVDAHGKLQTRSFTLNDLETAAAGYSYEVYDRMLLQRAIAQASRGEFLPLARLAYFSLGQDPETLAAVIDPTWSDAMFYAVECMDYGYGTGSAASRAAAYLQAGKTGHVDQFRLGSIFYADMPCPYWPVGPATQARPDYLTHQPFPIFILASTWDVATPFPNAQRLYSQPNDDYLIVQGGGPHVIFGRGNACPDDIITAWLVDGTRPSHRRTDCPDFMGTDPYVPIPAATVGGYKNGLAAMSATDDEINNAPDFWNWDQADTLQLGCLEGGWMRYTANADGFKLKLTACAFTAGLPLTGTGVINDTEGTFTLNVTSPGGTKLSYLRDADGNRSVTGTFRGAKAAAAH